jgi:predicted AlkP superfamily phosphohydrolase/phosphomutase
VEDSRVGNVLEEHGLGVRGLESVVPPVTVPAWACGFSGLSPDSLECFDFQSLDFDESEFLPVKREVFNHEGYWNYADESSTLFDVPGADRPEMDGCFVGGVFDFGEVVTEPEGLAERLEKEVGSPDIRRMGKLGSEEERRGEARRIFQFRTEVLEWLVENRDEEVFFSVFRLPDTMMHHTDSEREMVRSYDEVADFLGEFLEEFVNENDSMVVASDHGAVRYEKEFHANAWLEERGLLVREEGSESLMDDLVLSVADFGRKLGLRDFLVRLNSLAERTVDKDFSPGKSEVMDSIDWDETEAFAYVTGVCAYGGIWINDERLGGVVDEVEDKRSEIVRKLESEDEVVWVRGSADVYVDPPENFPDLVVRLDERTKFESSLHPKTMSEVSGFMHRKQGFVASDRELVDDPELIDLAPTILHLLGDTVPEHMEGESMLKGKVEKEAKETSGIDF